MAGQPWYRKQPIIIALLVFVAPLGIPLAWWASGWKVPTKVLASVLSATLFTVALVQSQKPKDSEAADSAVAGSASPSPDQQDGPSVRSLEPNKQQAAAPEESPSNMYALGDTITLGDFSYRVVKIEAYDRLSGRRGMVSERASEGATFLLVHYEIRNNGKETKTVFENDFQIVDSQDRRFRPSSEATTAYIMAGGDKDLAISELHPGITKRTLQIFEIPQSELTMGPEKTRLRIPKKGLGAGEAWVVLTTPDGELSVID